jgi:hypothetical protein
MGQGDLGGQHQSGVGAIRRRLCCDAQAVSGRGHFRAFRPIDWRALRAAGAPQ